MAGHKGTKAKENGGGSRGSSITRCESREDIRRSSRSRRGRSRGRERSRSSLSSRSRSKGRDRNKSSLSSRIRSKGRDRSKSIISRRSKSEGRDRSKSIISRRSRSQGRDRSKSIISRRSKSKGRDRSKSLSRRSRSKGRDRSKSIISRRRKSKGRDRGSPRIRRSVSHSSSIIHPSFQKRVDKHINSREANEGRSNSSDTTIDPCFEERVDEHIKSQEAYDTTIRSLGDKYSWEEYVEFLEPLISGVLKKLSKKDITLSREIYKRDPVNITSIEERLKHLSTKGERTIHVGLEMAYGAYKLYELTYENKILKAGKKAHKAAVLFLQAEILCNEGIELLKDCQHKFRRGWNLKKNRRGRTKK